MNAPRVAAAVVVVFAAAAVARVVATGDHGTPRAPAVRLADLGGDAGAPAPTNASVPRLTSVRIPQLRVAPRRTHRRGRHSTPAPAAPQVTTVSAPAATPTPTAVPTSAPTTITTAATPAPVPTAAPAPVVAPAPAPAHPVHPTHPAHPTHGPSFDLSG